MMPRADQYCMAVPYIEPVSTGAVPLSFDSDGVGTSVPSAGTHTTTQPVCSVQPTFRSNFCCGGSPPPPPPPPGGTSGNWPVPGFQPEIGSVGRGSFGPQIPGGVPG